ncbi:GSK3B-interacting protein-like, partial [Centruroides sculpturatus]|uniref:GSK3B-interacting protein-like n=1 Tax=Centruroides sculpturatus TaxID=218467 RepID=UPI000C6E6BFD
MNNNSDQENGITWREEAESVINDVKFAVSSISISEILPLTERIVYLNIETKENRKMCLEMSPRGFRVVSESFDVIDPEHLQNTKYYETLYSLLDIHSPQYRQLFGNAL